ncbi:hypothetical protein LSTR_LSTR015671 [Laodelphax striatellus]|uniref:Uncharacterized protein n=1 Tax=Laodelphax striatellus TaxID=195883 RepID=A0A482X3J8_LAOST|nr:hypothetical protein LSTR_LSTR015671 [Laodelphax striatellus]
MTAGRSYTRQISYGGPTLKIGSFPQFTLPDTDSNTEMKCKLSSSRTDYRDVYATRAYFDDEAGATKALNSSQFADYFVFRKKELWSCYIDKRRDSIEIKSLLFCGYSE